MKIRMKSVEFYTIGRLQLTLLPWPLPSTCPCRGWCSSKGPTHSRLPRTPQSAWRGARLSRFGNSAARRSCRRGPGPRRSRRCWARIESSARRLLRWEMSRTRPSPAAATGVSITRLHSQSSISSVNQSWKRTLAKFEVSQSQRRPLVKDKTFS